MKILVALMLIAILGCDQASSPQQKQPKKPISLAEAKLILAEQEKMDNALRTASVKGIQTNFIKLEADQEREMAVFLLMGKPGDMVPPGESLLRQRYFEKKLIDLKLYIEQYELVLQLSETPEQFENYRQECQQRLQEWRQSESQQTHLDIKKLK